MSIALLAKSRQLPLARVRNYESADQNEGLISFARFICFLIVSR
jgi:hypothetical protein